MIKRFTTLCVIALGLVLLASSGYAQTTPPNPSVLLKTTVVHLQREINHDRASLASSPKKLFALVKKVVLPIVDIQRMAGITLGKKWRDATKTQQQQFIDQFGLMLTKTYSKALLAAAQYDITIYPMRGNGWKNQQYVAVQGMVKPANGGSPSRVTYYLVRSGASWKIYDFAVEGVSFVQNFQRQFAKYTSLPPLLKQIEQVNQRQKAAS